MFTDESVALEKRSPVQITRLTELDVLLDQEIKEQQVRQTALQQLYKDYYEAQEAASRPLENALISVGLLSLNDPAPDMPFPLTEQDQKVDRKMNETYQGPVAQTAYRLSSLVADHTSRPLVHHHTQQTAVSRVTGRSPTADAALTGAPEVGEGPPKEGHKTAGLQGTDTEMMSKTSPVYYGKRLDGDRTSLILRRDLDMARDHLTAATSEYNLLEATYRHLRRAVKEWGLHQSLSQQEMDFLWSEHVEEVKRGLKEAEEALEKAKIAAINGGLSRCSPEANSVSSRDSGCVYLNLSGSDLDPEELTGLIQRWRWSVHYSTHDF